VTGSCVIRETTPTGSIYLYIYLSLSIYLVRGLGRAFSIYLSRAVLVPDSHQMQFEADGRAKGSSESTPVHMLALPSDVQLAIAAHLAHEAGRSACCDSVAAIASLSCASRACRIMVSEACAWEQAGSALGLASPSSWLARLALPELCRAACLGHRLCRSRAAEPCEGMHVSLLPRGGGWARELFEALHPLGLCAVANAADLAECLLDLPSVPFVIVPADARCAAARFFDRTSDEGPLCTLPCAHSCCDAPAAVGCLHCRKHGGAGARQLVARCAAELQLSSGAPGGGGPRRIVFAAASAEVREAYRKALLALGSAPRQQLRGAAAIVCPVDSRQ
jgi:hypothetical protein